MSFMDRVGTGETLQSAKARIATDTAWRATTPGQYHRPIAHKRSLGRASTRTLCGRDWIGFAKINVNAAGRWPGRPCIICLQCEARMEGRL